MDHYDAYTTAAEPVSLPTYRPRQMADVPEDVDFLMEHLNDPNYDLKKPHSLRSDVELHPKTKTYYENSDVDAESHYESDRYSTSRAESRNSTAIDFDECVVCLCFLLAIISHTISVSRRTPKYALPSPV